MTSRTTKKILKLQTDFLHQCVRGNQTLEEVMDDYHIIPETLAGWLMDREFRIRLHGVQRFLRKTRDLELDMSSRRAAQVLTRSATATTTETLGLMQRTACLDIIRLARDSQARRIAMHPNPDDVSKRSHLYHPEVPADEARELMAELARRDPMAPVTDQA